jgi:hypothetical protein
MQAVHRSRKRPSASLAALAVSFLALVFAMTGGATGAVHKVSSLITGKQIAKSTITSKQIKNGSLTLADIKPSELKKFKQQIQKEIVVPAGPKGDAGSAGPKGDAGSQGATGATGSTGPQGDPGTPGEKGDTGDQGPRGERGQNADGSVTTVVHENTEAAHTTADPGTTATYTSTGLDFKFDSTVSAFASWSDYSAADTLVSRVTALSANYNVKTAASGSFSLKIEVLGANDATSGHTNPDGYTNLVSDATSSAAGNGSIDAMTRGFRSTRAIAGATSPSPFVYRSLAELVAANPNMKIQRIYVELGGSTGGYQGFEGTVKDLTIGLDGGAPTKYSFVQ